MELTRNGKVVVVTSLFRMIFGGILLEMTYTALMMQTARWKSF